MTTYPLGTGAGKPQDATVFQYSSNVLVGETTGSGTASASSVSFGIDPVSLLDSSPMTATATSRPPPTRPIAGRGAIRFRRRTCSARQTPLATPPSTLTTASTRPGARSSLPSTPTASPVLRQRPPRRRQRGQRTPTWAWNCRSTTPPTSSPPRPTPWATRPPTPTLRASRGSLTASSTAASSPVAYQADVTCPAYGAAHVGGTTTATFDSAGDMTRRPTPTGTPPATPTTRPGHPGLVSSETDPDGTTTTYTYNAAGQVTSQVVSFGSYSATTVYAYDADGRQYCAVAPRVRQGRHLPGRRRPPRRRPLR